MTLRHRPLHRRIMRLLPSIPILLILIITLSSTVVVALVPPFAFRHHAPHRRRRQRPPPPPPCRRRLENSPSNHHHHHQSSSSDNNDDKSSLETISTTITTTITPTWIYHLNSSTKWLSTLAHALAVWTRPRSFEGPFIVVGTIAAAYLTEGCLKKIINQGRPPGAPFTDPGMPSSHALVSFFAAVAWSLVIGGGNHQNNRRIMEQTLLLSAATLIAVLRVLCGYHTVAQITVGAILGSLGGQFWFGVGETLRTANPRLTYILSWCFYLSGSALYIHKTMRTWVGTHARI